MQWRDIEDAPKDGRMVLLWISGRCEIGSYNVGRQFWCKESFPYTGTPAGYWMPLPISPHLQELDDELEEAYQNALAKND